MQEVVFERRRNCKCETVSRSDVTIALRWDISPSMPSLPIAVIAVLDEGAISYTLYFPMPLVDLGKISEVRF